MAPLNDNAAFRGVKRPLADVTACALNAPAVRRPSRPAAPSAGPGLATQLYKRSLGGGRVVPSPFAGFSIDANDQDVLKLQTESSSELNDRPPVPFAVGCAKTCSLTAVADEVGCLHLVDHRPDRQDRPWHHLRSLRPHANAIFDLDWSSDDRRIALGCGDRYCSIVDVPTGAVVQQWRGHHSSVKVVRYSPDDDNLICTGGRDDLINLWDVRQADPAVTLQNPSLSKLKGTVAVTSLAFLADGTIASVSAHNGGVRQWDLRAVGSGSKASPRKALVAETPSASSGTDANRGSTSLCLTRDRSRLLLVSKDSRVYEYLASRLDEGPQRAWQLPAGTIGSFYCRAAVSPDDVLCVGGTSGRPSFLDAAPHRAVSVMPAKQGHAAECTDVAWSHDGSACVTIGDDATVRIWRRP